MLVMRRGTGEPRHRPRGLASLRIVRYGTPDRIEPGLTRRVSGGWCPRTRHQTTEESPPTESAVSTATVRTATQQYEDLSLPFYGYNRPGAKVSEGVREGFWSQGMMAGFPAAYFCITTFSETDLTADLAKVDVPTLILHGADDQIVPIGASAMRSSKLIKNATLQVYKARRTACARPTRTG